MKLIKILRDSHNEIMQVMQRAQEGQAISDDKVCRIIANNIQRHDPNMPHKGANEYAWQIWNMVYEIEERNIYDN